MRHEPLDQFSVGGLPIAVEDASLRKSSWTGSAGLDGTLTFVATLLTAWTLWGIPVCHDVVWQFWIARQMLGGMRLYVDILEINPPLWFWSAIPVQYVAEAIGLPPLRLLVVIISCMGGASAFLIGRCVKEWSLSRRLFLMATGFTVGVLLPLYDFGQREQIALIATLPYAALIARRREGLEVSAALAVAIGAFAAYGFALKHYFCVGPVFLEIWLALGTRRMWRPVRPETAVLASAAAAYCAAVVVFASAFLSNIVPVVRLAYFGYEVPLAQMFDEPAQFVWWLALFSLVLYGCFSRGVRPFTTAMLLLTGGYAVAYFAQRKGWQYHAIPVTGTLLMALAARITEDGLGKIWRYPLGILTGLFAILFAVSIGRYSNTLQKDSDPLLRSVPPGSVVTMWASDPSWSWPMVEQHRLLWTSGFYAIWMLPAIAHAEVVGPPDVALQRLGASVRARVRSEMLCHPPDLILSERGTPYYSVRPAQFDTTAFFMRDPAIKQLLSSHYRQDRSTKWFDVFRRASDVSSVKGRWCISPR